MCNDGWGSAASRNVDPGEWSIPRPLPEHSDNRTNAGHSDVGSPTLQQISSTLIHYHDDPATNREINDFYQRDQHSMPMPEYMVRAQLFQFRRYPLVTLMLIFDHWLAQLMPLWNQTCDQCGLRLDELEAINSRANLGQPFVRLAPCDHFVCSRCIQQKRFLFVELGFVICCRVCRTCWLNS